MGSPELFKMSFGKQPLAWADRTAAALEDKKPQLALEDKHRTSLRRASALAFGGDAVASKRVRLTKKTPCSSPAPPDGVGALAQMEREFGSVMGAGVTAKSTGTAKAKAKAKGKPKGKARATANKDNGHEKIAGRGADTGKGTSTNGPAKKRPAAPPPASWDSEGVEDVQEGPQAWSKQRFR